MLLVAQLNRMLKLVVSYLLYNYIFLLRCCDCSFFMILEIMISFFDALLLLNVQVKSVQAADSALTLEKHRLKKLEELEALNQSLKSRSNEVSILFLHFYLS